MVSIFDPKKLTLALGDEIVTGFTEDFHITYDSNLNNLSFTLLGNSPYSFNLGMSTELVLTTQQIMSLETY